MGYYRAGFTEIVGVDIRHQPRYPFEFVQGDALEFLDRYGADFDVVHASPPCQAFVTLCSVRINPRTVLKEHPDLLTPTIAALQARGGVWVIENVMTAPMGCTVRLCGSSFGLMVERHRKFLSPVRIPSLPCRHEEQVAKGGPIGVYGTGGGRLEGRLNVNGNGHKAGSRAECSFAMGGLDWMVRREMNEAIPPAYTEYIGGYLLAYLEGWHLFAELEA